MMNKSNNSKKQYGIREIAKKANVSIATVDRVIHKRGGVAHKTKELILEIIDEYDYQPNILASRLRSNKTYSIAVLIPRVSENTDFWAAPYKGVRKAEKEIEQFGIEINTYFYRLSQTESFREQAQKLLDDEPDGVVIAPLFIPEAKSLSQLLVEQNIPFIFIDTEIANQKNITYIGPHIYQSGYVAGQLALYGMKNIESSLLVINHASINDDSHHLKEIERGFSDYINREVSDLMVHTLDLHGATEALLENTIVSYLKNHGDIQGIFVTNSRVFKIAKVLKQHDLQDRLLIGFDNIDENILALKDGVIDFLICHQPEEQGYRGVMNLYQNILLSQKIEKVQYMPIDIITKENCDFYCN